MATSYWQQKIKEPSQQVLDLEYDNHMLKARITTPIKQDPDNVAQLEDEVQLLNNMLDQTKDTIRQLEDDLAEERQYVKHLKAMNTSLEGAQKAMKQTSSGAKGQARSALAQEKRKVADLEDEVYSLKMELRDVKVDKKRLEFDVKQLQEQNSASVLDVSSAPSKMPTVAPCAPQVTPAPLTLKNKRKWDDVNTDPASDPIQEWKRRMMMEDRDDSEDDLPLAKRKILAIKKEQQGSKVSAANRNIFDALDGIDSIDEIQVPVSKRKIIAPVSQMARVKIESGPGPKAKK